MTTASSYRNWKSGALPPLISTLIIGGGIGYALSNGILNVPTQGPAASYALGLACAVILVQLLDLLLQGLGLNADPIPAAIDLGDRDALTAQAAKIGGNSVLASRARHLISAWGEGWDPRSVVSLAQYQAQQGRLSTYTAAVFPLVLLAASMWQGANTTLTVIGLIGVGIVVQARQSLHRQIDYYLENRLLSRLPGNLPTTQMTTKELAGAIGDAVEETFKHHMASPEAISDSVKKNLDGVTQEAVAQLENVGRALSSMSTQMTGGVQESNNGLMAALTQHAESLNHSGGSWGEGLRGVLSEQSDKMELTAKTIADELQKHTAGLDDQGTKWSEQINAVLADHSEKMEAATGNLATQLEAIATLQQDMEKVLHVQEVVDGTLKTVAATEEFQNTISSLRKHVEESDNLLREVTKPRMIRLVEEEVD